MARFPAAEPVALDYNLDEELLRERDLKREVADSTRDKNFGRAELHIAGAGLLLGAGRVTRVAPKWGMFRLSPFLHIDLAWIFGWRGA